MSTALLETRHVVPDDRAIERSVAAATDALLALQQPDGHFVFELEADVSIPSEYILFWHAIGQPADPTLEAKFAAFLRRKQADHGGWALVHDGAFNLSSSVKAYWALKTIGDDPGAPHMERARAAILAAGGAASANVFTRALLALFGLVPWRAIPVMPVETMLLPRWFPFHLTKISYWARTVLVPMMVVHAMKVQAENPRRVTLDELFVVPPADVKRWETSGIHVPFWTRLFRGIDRVLQAIEPHLPAAPRRLAFRRAEAFVTERLNGEDGLGAIYPAMAYSYLMYRGLGVADSDPRQLTIRRAIEKLVIVRETEAYCQPCVSPVWDTALACHALMEAAGDDADAEVRAALDWLKPRQVLDVKGDWAVQRPDVRPGGWAFQYANAHYPDLDDTAVVAMAMDRAGQRGTTDYGASIARAREWIEGLQSKNGGFGAFDADNDHTYLNAIPFADHGALLDPPTEDVTARCVSMLAQLGDTAADNPRLAAAIDYLRRTQCADGSWYGRWGLNYIYGTWSVLCALNAAKVDPAEPIVQKATAWLKSIQNPDGGWGEDAESYSLSYNAYEPAPSTASQTAWALLGLMAAGAVDDDAVARGVAYLVRGQEDGGFWTEKRFTATGFPRVFYLRYHGYAKFFPLWAIARYRNLMTGNQRMVHVGM